MRVIVALTFDAFTDCEHVLPRLLIMNIRKEFCQLEFDSSLPLAGIKGHAMLSA